MTDEKKNRLKELEETLKAKVKKFVEEYEKDGMKGAAALRAGYGNGDIKSAATQASRLLRDENVLEYIRLRAVEAYEALAFNKERIFLETVEFLQMCKAAKPVMEWNPSTKEWEETGEYRVDSNGIYKALKLMSEQLGISAEGDEDKNKFEVTINVNDGKKE